MDDEGGEWASYEQAYSAIFALPRGERLPVLVEWWGRDEVELDTEDVRRLFASVWIDTETAYEYADDVLSMLRWIGYVTDTEAKLAGDVTIFRGISGKSNQLGISWTPSLDRARWFAKRFAMLDPSHEGRVYRGMIPAAKIRAYLTSRREDEVLVDPDEIHGVELIETIFADGDAAAEADE